MVIFNSYVNLPEGKWHGNIEIFACRLQLGLKNIIVLVNVLWFPLKSRHYQWKPSTTALTREELEILKVRERCNTCATSARARVHINSYTYISICVYIYILYIYIYIHIRACGCRQFQSAPPGIARVTLMHQSCTAQMVLMFMCSSKNWPWECVAKPYG